MKLCHQIEWLPSVPLSEFCMIHLTSHLLVQSSLVSSFSLLQRKLPKKHFPWDSPSDPGASSRLRFPSPGPPSRHPSPTLVSPSFKEQMTEHCLEPEPHTCGWEAVITHPGSLGKAPPGSPPPPWQLLAKYPVLKATEQASGF